MPKQFKRLIKKLSDKDPAERRRAAEELAQGDERAIYPLIKALSDPSAGVQDAAMRSLIALGGEVTAYMVLPLLRENTFLRNTGLIILTSLGEISVPLLYPLLKDKDDDVRKFAIDVMGEIKTGVDPSVIIPSLKDPNANVRAAAAKYLGILGYRDAIPQIIEALHDEEWVCFSALEALGELKAEESVPAIAELLGNESEAVRFSAIETLGKLGSRKAIDSLMAYLPKASEIEQGSVIKSMIQIGITPSMRDITNYLLTFLEEGDWEDKEIALKGITALNCTQAVPLMVNLAGSLDPSLPQNDERIELIKETVTSVDSEGELLKLLETSDIKYRGKSFAIEILGEMKSKKAATHLVSYLNDTRRDLRRASAGALGEIGGDGVIEHLIEASQNDGDAHVRRSAIEALGTIQVQEAYEPLVGLLKIERYYDVMEKIVQALLKINAKTFLSDAAHYKESIREIIAKVSTDVDILLELAKAPEKKVKIAAIFGLGRVATDSAVSCLLSFLKDPDPEIRKTAVIGLGEARRSTPELFEALSDSDPWVRFYAIKAIAYSCEPEEAVQRISAMLTDEFMPVIMSAIDSIKEIGGREAYEALVVYEEHPNEEVREKILEALNAL